MVSFYNFTPFKLFLMAHIVQLLVFLLTIFTIASIYLPVCIGDDDLTCPEIERQALFTLKQSVEDPYNELSSWNLAQANCCTWNGVVCNNLTGHVIQLNLTRFSLNGTLGDSLINLRHLKYLNLRFNYFYGTIPASIGSFAELEYLDLTRAAFHGTVPHALGNLSSLRTLALGYSYNTVLNVDSLEWLSGLSHLEHLYMGSIDLRKETNLFQVTLPSLLDLKVNNCYLHTNVYALKEVNFTSLTSLDLSHNYFPSIPPWIFQLRKLEHLGMRGNRIKGPIPGAVGNLTSLNSLDLSYNDCSGCREIVKMCNMLLVDLSHNMLRDIVSTAFRNMSTCFLENLEYLNLRGNQLSGHLTHQFGEFKSLRSLDIGENSLYGPIPRNLGKLFLLEYLGLDDNKFTGNLPESIGQLHSLENFYVDGNMLVGVVSESHFANLTKLGTFVASRNRLSMNVSTNWIASFKVGELRLGSWNLGSSGQIPPWLHMQKNYIRVLDLSDTGLTCEVPDWFWQTYYLNISHNQIYGNLPNILKVTTTYLNSNRFSGSLPQVVYASVLDFSNNMFTGGISRDFLCGKGILNFGVWILRLSDNMLSGELPDCWTNWSVVSFLHLGNNNISGQIPKSIAFLKRLQYLNLFNNTLYGQIPSSIQNCTSLRKIDLSNNRLTGKIPPVWLGTSLKILMLRSNKLSGNIPSDICRLNSLQILDLSDNLFDGVIPSCVDNFTSMIVSGKWEGSLTVLYTQEGDIIESALVATKGRMFQYDTFLNLVTNIDLSRNNLSGVIPYQLTRLVELRSLNLSENHLSGFIPDGIGNMKQLESLDLSINFLSGEIPNSMAVLTSLNHLNLSYNNLTGRIPQSTQFTTLPASSFIGTSLCGPPLPTNCKNDGKIETPGLTPEEDSGIYKVEWLYLSISSGFVVGLSIVCNTLIFKKTWRYAYFKSIDNLWNKVWVFVSVKLKKHD